MERFYLDSHTHIFGTTEHIVSVIVYFAIGFMILLFGKNRWNEKQKKDYIVLICFLVYGLQWAKTGIRYYLGVFDHTTDLPLQLCNLMPLILGIAYYFESQKLFGIIFFWIMNGTLQSNFTPSLMDFFPHYESIRYWTTHALIPFAAVYGLVVLSYKVTYKDVIISWLAITFGAYFMYWINTFMGANYWFVIEKPISPTMYDALGPWPNYMFQLFPVALVLFSVTYWVILLVQKSAAVIKLKKGR